MCPITDENKTIMFIRTIRSIFVCKFHFISGELSLNSYIFTLYLCKYSCFQISFTDFNLFYLVSTRSHKRLLNLIKFSCREKKILCIRTNVLISKQCLVLNKSWRASCFCSVGRTFWWFDWIFPSDILPLVFSCFQCRLCSGRPPRFNQPKSLKEQNDRHKLSSGRAHLRSRCLLSRHTMDPIRLSTTIFRIGVGPILKSNIRGNPRLIGFVSGSRVRTENTSITAGKNKNTLLEWKYSYYDVT